MRERTRVLVVTSGALTLSVLTWFNYPAVLPLVVEDWGLSGLAAGLIFGAFQAGYLLAIVPVGALADRHSPRWVIATGAAGAGLASLGFALLADGVLSGIVLRGIGGAFMAGVYVPGMRFLSDWFPADARGRALGLYVGTFSLGSGFTYLVGASLAVAADWRVAIAATSVGALFVAPGMLWLTSDHPRAAARTGGFAWAVLRDRSYLAAVSVYSWHNWELFGVRNWLVAFLVAAPAVAAAGSTSLAGTIAGAMIALGGIGNVLGGSLSDRIGRSRVVALSLGASGLVSAFLGVLGWLPLPALVALVLVYGVALTADSAPISTTVTEIVDDEHVGTALSVQSFVGFTTTVVSPIVFG
ncbi:MAG TPA: MFS transporter, partial [Halobacteriales archaeon]|nr:MFS transporter [Halobacteriales archaeon]